MKRKIGTILFLFLACGWALARHAFCAPAGPRKLSDIHHFLISQIQDTLVPDIKIKPMVIGRSSEIISTGRFRHVELELSEFKYQDLQFEKGELIFEHFWVDPKAMAEWQLKVEKLGEVQSRLIFTLPSLQAKLSKMAASDVKVKPVLDDVEASELELNGRGSFCLIPMHYTVLEALHWDGKQLWLQPKSLRWGWLRIPLWLHWLDRGAAFTQPILDLSKSWISYNIQELHVSWDRVTLSTNW